MSLTLLALDTSTEACSVALLHNNEITHLDELAQRTHTKRILPMVDQILSQSGIKLNQLDALVFGRGPGSFTGVRVGAGIAQGLALGADLPVLPVSNLSAMAQAVYEQHQGEKVICAIDARMNEVYFSVVQRKSVQVEKEQGIFSEFFTWQHLIDEQVCRPEQAIALLQQQDCQSALWCGTGWAAYPQFAESQLGQVSDILLPSAKYMLPLAIPAWYQQQIISALAIEPVYLRNEVTWKKLPGRE